jgi:hypothetical protein
MADPKPHNMLTLQKDSLLNEEQRWLKCVYSNIVSKLIEMAIGSKVEFDPFTLKFMGVNTIEHDRFMYKAFLEVTSFFGGSKGGRGALLEKIIASLGGQFSSRHQTLSELINALSSKNISQQSGRDQNQDWIIETEVGELKFDMTNFVNETLVILELKNRVDSGGTAARQEALTKLLLSAK